MEHHFNTSYVLVQARNNQYNSGSLIFQYIICFGSSILGQNSNALKDRFQYIICFGSSNRYSTYYRTTNISIHHMFWFKFAKFALSAKLQHISIHHMFWFKKTFTLASNFVNLFQYIICFGSSLPLWRRAVGDCISIHHMFWFKIYNFSISYIISPISIHHMFWFKLTLTV